MAYDGTLKFDTSINPNGFQNGINKLGTIVKGAAVFKVLSAGVDMVKNSVDAAFGRIDTMEQFNRVMNVMTHDTGITNKALADTNQIVKGTAYGLNVASKAVQSFVSRGMEVKKSTDTVEGFADAVSFFGDGTNATLESVMSALGKMQTKGNVTMEHLEMLFNAGIPAVEIYANAVGMSADEVTAAISKGKLQTDDFISTMNQAFKTGVEGFPSIAGAAKEAGASWTGTFDNMRAAITRGTQAIITSIDSALESVGKPSTREMIANFGKTFEKVLNTIAGAAGGVVKHLDLIAFGITTVGAVMLGLRVGKVLTGIVQGFQLAAIQVTLYTMSVNGAVTADALQTAGLTAKSILVGVLTGKITIATAAQYAWNAAMSANPIGLVIAGIGLLVAAVVGVTMVLNKNSVAYEKAAEKVDNLKNAHEQLKTAMESSKASYEDNVKNQAASSITAGELLNTLTRLSSVENKSIEEKKQMALIVKQLDQSYGGLNLTYDEGNDLLNQNIDKIKEYCGAQNFIAEATLREERYNELLQEQGQLTAALNEEQNHGNEILKQWRAGEISEKECNKLIKEISELENDYNKSFEENADKIKSLEADIVKTNTENAEKIVSDYEWLNSTITKSGKTAQEVADEWGISGEKLRAELENQNISLDEWVQNAEESVQKWQDSFNSHKDAVINSFEEIPEKLDMSFEDMTENLNKNAERYAEWQKNISKLSKVMSEESVAEIIKLGPAFKLNRDNRKSGL